MTRAVCNLQLGIDTRFRVHALTKERNAYP